MNERHVMLRKIVIFGLFALPVLGGAFFLYRYGINVLFMDEFELTSLATGDHLPGLAELFRQHNEHRIFFPKIVYFFLAKASAMNSLAAMWASFTLVTLRYGAVLWQLARRTSGPAMLCVGLLTGCALFYPSQMRNILWGFQLTFYMTFVFSLLTICLFQNVWDKNRASDLSWPLAASLATAFIASFSSAQGLMIWPVIAALWLLAAGKKALTAKNFWLWLAAMAVAWLLYFHGYHHPGDHPSLATTVALPSQWMQYLLTLFGAAFGLRQPPILIGALGLLILGGATAILAHFIISCRRQQSAGLLAVGIIGYSLLCGLSITIGRAEFGWRQALSSRYCTFTLAMVWGIFLYLATVPSLRRIKTNNLAVFLSLILLAGMAVGLPRALIAAEAVKQQNLLGQYYLQTANWQSNDKLKVLYPKPEMARWARSQLRDRNYNIFAGLAAQTPDWRAIELVAAPADFPLILDRASIEADTLLLRGWCFDPYVGKPVRSLWLNLGKKRFLLFSSVPRPDIARALKNDNLATVGFTADIPLAAIPPDDISLRFDVIAADGKKLYEVTKAIRFVRDASGGARLESPAL